MRLLVKEHVDRAWLALWDLGGRSDTEGGRWVDTPELERFLIEQQRLVIESGGRNQSALRYANPPVGSMSHQWSAPTIAMALSEGVKAGLIRHTRKGGGLNAFQAVPIRLHLKWRLWSEDFYTKDRSPV